MERAPLSFAFRFGPELPAMRFNDLPRDIQTEAGAADLLLYAFVAYKLFEKMRDKVGRNAEAGIGNGKRNGTHLPRRNGFIFF